MNKQLVSLCPNDGLVLKEERDRRICQRCGYEQMLIAPYAKEFAGHRPSSLKERIWSGKIEKKPRDRSG